MALNVRTLAVRTLSALFFTFALIGSFLWNAWSFFGFLTLISFIAIFEYQKLIRHIQDSVTSLLPVWIFNILLLALYPIAVLFPETVPNTQFFLKYLSPFLVLLFVILSVEMVRQGQSLSRKLPFGIFPVVYITSPVLMALFMFFSPLENNTYSFNAHLPLGIIYLIWINDTGAYLLGSLIGKNKLIERISPGKTIEGTLGGIIFTIGLSWCVYKVFPELPFFHWIMLAIITAIFSTLGDLFESLLKRTAGIKDSGQIMPGHGGALDRFDSFLFVMPAAYCYLYWCAF